MKKLSIIVPCFNEQEVIRTTHGRLMSLDIGETEKEIIYINDGSTDATLEILKSFTGVKVLSFSRNFGHQAAVSAGMAEASGEALVIIDADLQDPPELIPEMIKLWEQGNKVVYGKRTERRGETAFKKATASVYYRVVNKLSGGYIPKDTGDFRLIDAEAAATITNLPEKNRFLRGLGAWVGYKQCALEYTRDERAAGQTKYTMKKMLRLAEDGIVAFSDAPLRLPMYTGVVLMLLSLVYLIVSVVLTILGLMSYIHIILAAVFMLIALIMIFLGIMGLYMARIYDEAKGRPNYIIEERTENK